MKLTVTPSTLALLLTITNPSATNAFPLFCGRNAHGNTRIHSSQSELLAVSQGTTLVAKSPEDFARLERMTEATVEGLTEKAFSAKASSEQQVAFDIESQFEGKVEEMASFNGRLDSSFVDKDRFGPIGGKSPEEIAQLERQIESSVEFGVIGAAEMGVMAAVEDEAEREFYGSSYISQPVDFASFEASAEGSIEGSFERKMEAEMEMKVLSQFDVGHNEAEAELSVPSFVPVQYEAPATVPVQSTTNFFEVETAPQTKALPPPKEYKPFSPLPVVSNKGNYLENLAGTGAAPVKGTGLFGYLTALLTTQDSSCSGGGLTSYLSALHEHEPLTFTQTEAPVPVVPKIENNGVKEFLIRQDLVTPSEGKPKIIQAKMVRTPKIPKMKAATTMSLTEVPEFHFRPQKPRIVKFAVNMDPDSPTDSASTQQRQRQARPGAPRPVRVQMPQKVRAVANSALERSAMARSGMLRNVENPTVTKPRSRKDNVAIPPGLWNEHSTNTISRRTLC